KTHTKIEVKIRGLSILGSRTKYMILTTTNVDEFVRNRRRSFPSTLKINRPFTSRLSYGRWGRCRLSFSNTKGAGDIGYRLDGCAIKLNFIAMRTHGYLSSALGDGF